MKTEFIVFPYKLSPLRHYNPREPDLSKNPEGKIIDTII